MAINKEKKSNLLLGGRRYTHENINDALEAFTSVLDINSSEIYVDDKYVPTSSLPTITSANSGQIVSQSDGDYGVLKAFYRVPMVKSNLASYDGRETYFFCDPPPTLDASYPDNQTEIGLTQITGSQIGNFISPKYSEPSLGGSRTEDGTPGYGVTVWIGNRDHYVASTVDSNGTKAPVTDYTFDYKTGILQFSTTGRPSYDDQVVFVTAYQYAGKTLSSNEYTGSFSGSFVGSMTGYVESTATSSFASGSDVTALMGATSSYVTNSQTGSFASGSDVSNLQQNVTSILDNYITKAQTGSFASGSDVSQILNESASYATHSSGDVTFRTGSFSGPLMVDGIFTQSAGTDEDRTVSAHFKYDISASGFLGEYWDITDQVVVTSESTAWGNSMDDTHTFSGSMELTGSLTLTGSVTDLDVREGDYKKGGVASSTWISESMVVAGFGSSGGASGIFVETGSYYATSNDLQVTGSLTLTEPLTGSTNADTSVLQQGLTTTLNADVGSISTGETFAAGTSIEAILRSMLIDFIPPTFTTFGISGLDSTLEVGDTDASTINSGYFATGSSTSDGSGFENNGGSFQLSLSGNHTGNGNISATYSGNSNGTISFTSPTIKRTSIGNVTFTLLGTDSAGNETSKTKVASFRIPIFYGGSSNTGAGLDDSVLASIIGDISSSITSTSGTSQIAVNSQNHTYGKQTLLNTTSTSNLPSNTKIKLPASVQNASNYTYIIYPSSYGDLTSILKNDVQDEFGTFSKLGTADHTRLGSVSIEYVVYRSSGQQAFDEDNTLTIND